MKKIIALFLYCILGLTGCAAQQSHARDIKADTRLQPQEIADSPNVDQTLNELQEREDLERQRDLERHINDSFIQTGDAAQ